MRRRTLLLGLGSTLFGVLVWRVLFVRDEPNPDVAAVVELGKEFRRAWDAQDVAAIAALYPKDMRKKIAESLPAFVARQRLGGWRKTSLGGDPEIYRGRIRLDYLLAGSTRFLHTDWEKRNGDWWLVMIDFS